MTVKDAPKRNATAQRAAYTVTRQGLRATRRSVYGIAMSEPLTDGEQRCLDIVADILAAGRQPSILEVARQMGITKGGANHHMRALREKGYLRGPRVVGHWALTRAAKREREKKDLARA